MKHLIALSLLLAVVTGCQKKVTIVTSIPNYNSLLDIHDPTFDSYVEDVENILEYTSGVRVVRFIDDSELEGMKSTVVGICKRGAGVVLIKKSTWGVYSEDLRVTLIMHELGHCDFYHDHTTENADDECNNTIMHPSLGCAIKAFRNLTMEQLIKEFK